MVSVRRMAFGFLMMKYGNGGSCCSADNHKFMKALYEGDEEAAGELLHRVTPDCTSAYNRINDKDYVELTEAQKKRLKEIAHWEKVIGVEGEDNEKE